MGKAAKRQHYIARFYLRNFAEPIFSDNLRFYDLQKEQWEKRSTRGVGWFPHLFSMIDAEGKRTDEFDQYIKREVEDPAAPALGGGSFCVLEARLFRKSRASVIQSDPLPSAEETRTARRSGCR